MVDLGTAPISYQGIEEQIDSAEAFERARGGTIDAGYRERVRRAIIQQRQLQVVSEQRIGRDVQSAKQRQAVAERDARREAGYTQISRSQLEAEGKLAGSRGAEGITRSPSIITGYPSAAGARGGFAGDKPIATFESREQMLARQTKEAIRPRIERSFAQRYDAAQAQTPITKQAAIQQARVQALNQATPTFERPQSTRAAPILVPTKTPLAKPSGQRDATRAAPYSQTKEGVISAKKTKTLKDPLTPFAKRIMEFARQSGPKPGDQTLFGNIKGQFGLVLGAGSVGVGGLEVVGAIGQEGSKTLPFLPTPFKLAESFPRFLGERVFGKRQITVEPSFQQKYASGTFGPEFGEFLGNVALISDAPTPVLRIPKISRRPVSLGVTKLEFEGVKGGAEAGRVVAFETRAQAGISQSVARVRGVQRSLGVRGGAAQQTTRLQVEVVGPSGRAKSSEVAQKARIISLGSDRQRVVVQAQERTRFGLPKTYVTKAGVKDVAQVDGLRRSLIGGQTYQRRLGGLVRPKKLESGVGITKEDFRFGQGDVERFGGTGEFFGFRTIKRVEGVEVVKAGEGVRVPKPKSTRRLPRAQDLLPRGKKGQLGTSGDGLVALQKPKIERPSGFSKDLEAAFDLSGAQVSRRAAIRGLPIRSRFKITSKRIRGLPTGQKALRLGNVPSIASSLRIAPISASLQKKVLPPGVSPKEAIGQLQPLKPVVEPKSGIKPSSAPQNVSEVIGGGRGVGVGALGVPFVNITRQFGRPPERDGGLISQAPPGGFLRPERKGAKGWRFPKARRKYTPSLFGTVLAERGIILRQTRGRGLPGFLVRGEGPGFRFPKTRSKKKVKKAKKRSKRNKSRRKT